MVHQTSLRAAVAAVVALLGTAVAAGQDQMPFRSTIDFVSTEVIAREDGKFVPNLTQDEFRVYEDDVLQTITLFEPYIGGRSLGNLSTASPTRPAVREGLVLPAARPPADTSGRLFIVFVDDLHFTADETPQVREVMRMVRDILIHDNDLVGLVSSGYSSIEFDPAYDFEHRRFNEAIGKTVGGGPTINQLVSSAPQEAGEGPIGLRFDASQAFRTAASVLEQMAEVTDRRKVFVYISNGYNFDPLAEDRWNYARDRFNQAAEIDIENEEDPVRRSQLVQDEFSREELFRRGSEFSYLDLTQQIAYLTEEAQRANVTFYPIDPRGLTTGTDISTWVNVSYSSIADYIATQTSTLRVLAQQTGGFCICSTNDFEGGLQRIDAETSDFYRVGYTSSNPDPTHRRREIRIEVTRPGVDEVIYRREYTLLRPGS